jgi:hypothetical protein
MDTVKVQDVVMTLVDMVTDLQLLQEQATHQVQGEGLR